MSTYLTDIYILLSNVYFIVNWIKLYCLRTITHKKWRTTQHNICTSLLIFFNFNVNIIYIMFNTTSSSYRLRLAHHPLPSKTSSVPLWTSSPPTKKRYRPRWEPLYYRYTIDAICIAIFVLFLLSLNCYFFLNFFLLIFKH